MYYAFWLIFIKIYCWDVFFWAGLKIKLKCQCIYSLYSFIEFLTLKHKFDFWGSCNRSKPSIFILLKYLQGINGQIAWFINRYTGRLCTKLSCCFPILKLIRQKKSISKCSQLENESYGALLIYQVSIGQNFFLGRNFCSLSFCTRRNNSLSFRSRKPSLHVRIIRELKATFPLTS